MILSSTAHVTTLPTFFGLLTDVKVHLPLILKIVLKTKHRPITGTNIVKSKENLSV